MIKLHGNTKHRLETGLGVVFGETSKAFEEKYTSIPGATLNVGYRFIPKKEKGVSLRLMFTPILNKEGFIPWFGASIGLSIKKVSI